MQENKYDDPVFFEKYSQMDRSRRGLAGAGEWETLQAMLPDFRGKRVLDLGCGYGWHCLYAAEHGAASVVGVDLSKKMLHVAQSKTHSDKIEYLCSSIEAVSFPPHSFDIVLSSLALHYVADYDGLLARISQWLEDDGKVIFTVEHPVFTAQGPQDWVRDSAGNILYFPVDNYFFEGKRNAVFLGEPVVKYHRTLTTYLRGLLAHGFQISDVAEPQPSDALLRENPAMQDELRRPMMLIISAVKVPPLTR